VDGQESLDILVLLVSVGLVESLGSQVSVGLVESLGSQVSVGLVESLVIVADLDLVVRTEPMVLLVLVDSQVFLDLVAPLGTLDQDYLD